MIEIKESELRDAVMMSIQREVANRVKSRLTLSCEFSEMLEGALRANLAGIGEQIRWAVREAVQSKEVRDSIRGEITRTMCNRMGGAFESTLRAAGKRAALDKRILDDLAKSLSISDALVAPKN